MNGIEIRKLSLAWLIAGFAFAPQAHGQSVAGEQAEAAGWTALFRDVRFTLGPVRWSADVTTEFRMQRMADQESQRAFVGSCNAAFGSYVYQPWFAQVSANLGFVWSGAGGAEEAGSTAAFTGGANLAMFPQSRFPFEALVNVTDSRASEEILGNEYRNVLVGLKQSYRFANDAQVTGRVDHSTITGPRIGRDVLDVASATYFGKRADHTLSADGFWSLNTRGSGAVDNRISRLSGQHAYVPAENLSVDTMATYDWQEVRLGEGAIAGRFAQLASYASWRPEEGEPLYDEKHPMLLTAGVRLSAAGLEVGGAEAEAIGVNASAGVSYEINPATRVNAGGSLTQASSDATGSVLFTDLSAGVTYDPAPILWSDFAYSWRLSGGGRSATGGEVERQSLFAQANHQVTRDLALQAGSRLTVTLGQGIGASASTRQDNALALSNNVQATYSLPGDAASQAYFSAGASDARSIGTPETAFQLVNVQLSGQAAVNALSHVTANLTVQGSRQRGEPSEGTTTGFDTGFNVSTFGSVSYQHRRAFGIPRMRFLATYTANPSQLQSRAEGDVTAPPQQTGDSLDARLEYRIGKLDTRLVFRTSTIDGRRNSGVYFRATRYF